MVPNSPLQEEHLLTLLLLVSLFKGTGRNRHGGLDGSSWCVATSLDAMVELLLTCFDLTVQSSWCNPLVIFLSLDLGLAVRLTLSSWKSIYGSLTPGEPNTIQEEDECGDFGVVLTEF